MRPPRSRRPRGVSLVEALVALAVMAFGVLGVLGVQATLRNNADVSRQRSEAVRIAQERIETLRAYRKLESEAGDGSFEAWESIADSSNEAITDGYDDANTAFTLSQAADDAPAGRAKSVVVRVEWRDRTSETANQAVVFGSMIAGVPPELAGSLALPGDRTALATPQGRHRDIPVEAVQIEGDPGHSRLRVPDGSSLVFDNVTGVITSVCTPAGRCTTLNAFLVSGTVRFATDRAPTAEDAEFPTPLRPDDLASLPPQDTGFVTVQRELTPQPLPDACLHKVLPDRVDYWCAVPFSELTRSWSGWSWVWPNNLPTANPPAGDHTATSSTRVRICRYAPVEVPPRNLDHPRKYLNVRGALTNQNFLVIKAGNGSDTAAGGAYDCPRDDESTPLDTDTWLHQPQPATP